MVRERIVVICSVLDEERNIANFIEGYSWADHILLADGGSKDKTRDIALSSLGLGRPSVEIKNTNDLRVDTPGDPYHDFYTVESAQTNRLIAWARGIGATWIIKDDCDSWPNSHLKREAKNILKSTTEAAVFAYHLYIWGQDQYFPKMNRPGPGLWAWRPQQVYIRSDDSDVTRGGITGVPTEGLKLDFPMALLHYFAPDEETVRQKTARKAAKGRKWVHPLEGIYAPPEPLPEWAL